MCLRLENDLIHWCLQSLHSPPLDLPGYVSGSEVSEEEDNAHCHDMGQVGQVCTHVSIDRSLDIDIDMTRSTRHSDGRICT